MVSTKKVAFQYYLGVFSKYRTIFKTVIFPKTGKIWIQFWNLEVRLKTLFEENNGDQITPVIVSTSNVNIRRGTERRVVMVLMVLFAATVNAQNVGDYRTKNSGVWNTSIWEMYTGNGWSSDGIGLPSANNGAITITIKSGHIVTINTSTSIGKTVIESGAQLQVVAGKTVTFATPVSGNKITVNGTFTNNGTIVFTGTSTINAGGVLDNRDQGALTFNAGTVVQVNGTLKNASGAVTTSSADRLFFNNGSIYQHTATIAGGFIPSATWNVGSLCQISGYTTSGVSPTNTSQSFYNFDWNTKNFSATAFLSLNHIAGQFTVTSTGTGSLTIQTLSDVQKDFVVAAGHVDISNLAVKVGGNVTFALGAVTGDAVALTLKGTSAETVDVKGFALKNLTVDNASNNIVLASPLNIIDNVSILSSNTNLISNGNLHLLSTSADGYVNDASIDAIPSGSSITGNVMVDRYMSGNGNIYRYISSPVANATVSQLQQDIPVYGKFSGASPCLTGTCQTSMYYYDANKVAYVPFPTGVQTSATKLVPGRGYTVLVNQTTLGAVTIHWNGTINQGTINLPVGYNSASPTSWNLVGNPYPSTIDWNKGQVGNTGWVFSNVAQAVAVRDNRIGVFQYYPDDLGNETFNTGKIAKGQAFWVRTTGPNPTLQINENAKVSDKGTFYRTASPEVTDRIVLSLTNGSASDRAYFKVVDGASEQPLDYYDAPKMTNTGASTLNLSTVSKGTAMAINAVSNVNCGDTVQITMTGASAQKLAAGAYEFSFAATGIMSIHTWMLYDAYLKKVTEISKDGTYAFTVTTDRASANESRFKMYATGRPVDLTLAVTGTTQLCSEDAGSVKIARAQADTKYTLEINGKSTGASLQGNGSDLTFVVDAALLSVGKNAVRVVVAGECSQTYLANSLVIVKSEFFTPVVEVTTHCQKGSVTLQASNVTDGNSVRWYASATSTEVLSTSPEFVTPVITKSKIYYVSGVTALGCESARTPVQATIVAFDSVQITPVGLTLQSSYAEGNQWYFNDQPISGATTSTIDIQQDGVYSVEVVIDGCSTIARYNATTAPTVETTLSKTIRAYPNPVANAPVHIEVPTSVQSAALLNSLGAVLIPEITFAESFDGMKKADLELSNFPSGVYFVYVKSADAATTIKIAKN